MKMYRNGFGSQIELSITTPILFFFTITIHEIEIEIVHCPDLQILYQIRSVHAKNIKRNRNNYAIWSLQKRK